MLNPSPTPLSPRWRYSAPLGPNRPHLAYPCSQGLVLELFFFASQCMPNPSPTPLTGPTRPHWPILVARASSLSHTIESQCMPNPSPTPLSPRWRYSALLGRTRPEPAPRGPTWPILEPGPSLRVIVLNPNTPPQPHCAPLDPNTRPTACP